MKQKYHIWVCDCGSKLEQEDKDLHSGICEDCRNEIKEIICQEAIHLPLIFDWVEYEGERYFASWNLDESIKHKKQMFDLHYCATAALNNSRIEMTVPYSKNKFKRIN